MERISEKKCGYGDGLLSVVVMSFFLFLSLVSCTALLDAVGAFGAAVTGEST